MQDWINSFIDARFMPHGHCYLWRPDILWAHVLSDATIAIAYYLIPILLGIFLYKRKKTIPYPEVIGLFVAFIFLCGTTHLMAIYVVWFPLYEQQGWIKAMTALVSLATAMVLIPKLPQLISIPDVYSELKKSEKQVQDLLLEKETMESIHNLAMDRENRIITLKEEVNALLQLQDLPIRYQILNDGKE